MLWPVLNPADGRPEPGYSQGSSSCRILLSETLRAGWLQGLSHLLCSCHSLTRKRGFSFSLRIEVWNKRWLASRSFVAPSSRPVESGGCSAQQMGSLGDARANSIQRSAAQISSARSPIRRYINGWLLLDSTGWQ